MYGSGGGGGNNWRDERDEKDERAARRAAEEYSPRCEIGHNEAEKKEETYTPKDVDDWEREFRESHKTPMEMRIIDSYISKVKDEPETMGELIKEMKENRDPEIREAKERNLYIQHTRVLYKSIREKAEKLRERFGDSGREMADAVEKELLELEKADLDKLDICGAKEQRDKAKRIRNGVYFWFFEKAPQG